MYFENFIHICYKFSLYIFIDKYKLSNKSQITGEVCDLQSSGEMCVLDRWQQAYTIS